MKRKASLLTIRLQCYHSLACKIRVSNIHEHEVVLILLLHQRCPIVHKQRGNYPACLKTLVQTDVLCQDLTMQTLWLRSVTFSAA